MQPIWSVYSFLLWYDEFFVKDVYKRQVCTEHGFAFPKTATCTKENYRDIPLPFDFPVIVKPSNSVAYWNCRFPHKKKVFVAENQAEFSAILTAIYGSSYQDPLIIQEYIPGDDSNMRVMNCYCGKMCIRDRLTTAAALALAQTIQSSRSRFTRTPRETAMLSPRQRRSICPENASDTSRQQPIINAGSINLCKMCIRDRPHGGLLPAPTHLLEPEVPWENIIAYVEACRDYKPGK